MGKIIPDNRKFYIDHNFFDHIDEPKKAFWLGYLTKYYRSILATRGLGDFAIRIAFNRIELAQTFLSDLKSNYPIKSAPGRFAFAIQFQSKNLLMQIKKYIANLENSLVPEFSRYFICGILCVYGEFVPAKYCSGAMLKFSGTNANLLDIFNKHLDKINVASYFAKRKNVSPILVISSTNNLFQLHNELCSLEQFIHCRMYRTFHQFIQDEQHHINDNDLLISMILNDIQYGLSKRYLCSKFKVSELCLNRILSGQIDKYTIRINATDIISQLPRLAQCNECHIYTPMNIDCVYCSKNVSYIKSEFNFRMNKTYHAHIRIGLKKLLAGKDVSGLTIQRYTGWTFQELKSWIENQFEWWMTWDNWKGYSARKWNDNDPSTWVWNIDHIIPQSEFYFKDKHDPEFKKCWALSNLRPLSGKQNIKDGASRNRDKKK